MRIKPVKWFIYMISLCMLSGCGNAAADSGNTPEPVEQEDEVIESERQLEEAITALENHLPDLEGIEEVLPGDLHVGDSCQGDIGNDGRQDIVILLESWETFSSGEDTNDTRKSRRVVCVFTEKEPDVYEYVCKNGQLVRNSDGGGIWGDPYAGIKIQDGFLTISDYGGSNDRWGDDFTFGLGESGDLELYKIRRYDYHIVYRYGNVHYFDYTTCIREDYVIEDCSIEEATFSSSTDFTPREGIPVLFEDTREIQDWMR